MVTNPITDLLAVNLNTIDPRISRQLIDKYINYILRDKKVKVFTGIPREYTNKYIVDFYKILKLNSNQSGKIFIPLKLGETDSYVGYFVDDVGVFNAFSSFKQAYMFASKSYLRDTIIYADDIIKELADNIDVFFGQVLVDKHKAIVHKDLISVVDKNFHQILF